MKGSEIIKAVAQEAAVTNVQSASVMKLSLKKIISAVSAGEIVTIKDVGRFKTSKPRADGSTVIIFKPTAGATSDAGEAAAK